MLAGRPPQVRGPPKATYLVTVVGQFIMGQAIQQSIDWANDFGRPRSTKVGFGGQRTAKWMPKSQAQRCGLSTSDAAPGSEVSLSLRMAWILSTTSGEGRLGCPCTSDAKLSASISSG